ncbi:MAG: helix-turn-helix domain-containing protein [Chloroflexi bacterium]|nr:helix-turn-helix domain-containing protein [Chloroflexota bacterium]
MGFREMSMVVEGSRCTGGSAYFLLLMMANHTGEQGICFASNATLQRDCRMGLRTVQRLKQELVACGELEELSPDDVPADLPMPTSGRCPRIFRIVAVAPRGARLAPLNGRGVPDPVEGVSQLRHPRGATGGTQKRVQREPERNGRARAREEPDGDPATAPAPASEAPVDDWFGT